MAGTIVVALTDTEAGRRALAWAEKRATQRRQPLHLVTVVGGATGAVGEGKLLDAAVSSTDHFLSREAERLRAAGLTVEAEVRQGNPVTHIANATEGAALLVIGSDFGDGSGRRRGLHGVRIVAAAHCPTVVVGASDEDAERHGVVVGVDGSPVSEAALKFAAAEADRLGEPLVVVSVWTPVQVPHMPLLDNDNYLASMQSITEEMQSVALAGLGQDYPDLVVEREVVSGYPSHAISDRAETARLAVVGSHGRGTIARFLLGSVSHEVLVNLTSPTAIVR